MKWPTAKMGILSTLVALAWLGASAAMAQSGGDFEIKRSTIDGGGSTERSPDNIFIRGTIGQPDVGPTYFGTIYLTGGFWATQGRTGIFFIDGFESGDTSAWTQTVGASLGPNPNGSQLIPGAVPGTVPGAEDQNPSQEQSASPTGEPNK